MSDISVDELKKEIIGILNTADLTVLTSKSVRLSLEKKLGCSLLSRKKQIDAILMDEINKRNNDSDSESDDDDEKDKVSEESEEEKPKKKRASAARKTPAKRKRKSVNGTDTNSDSDDGSDEDYKQKKKPAAKKGKAGPKKGNGFTRPYNLSPELSALMGADALPRHAVVKKIWSIIKERNLYDPKNKQYAICDEQLMGIMKIKRFRTFGMLKYLKPHFIN